MKNVLLALLVFVLGFLVFVQTRPDTFHVERSASIAAPPDSLYAMMTDFHRWDGWSPWAKLDPAMKTDYSGPESGVGASYHWTGNDKVGEGRMTLTEVQAPSHVGIRLEFIKPFAGVSTTNFALAPDAGGTRVTWSMDGKSNFIAKAMCIFTPMDKMIGPDFERGLGNLKREGEAAASAPAAPADSSTAPAGKS